MCEEITAKALIELWNERAAKEENRRQRREGRGFTLRQRLGRAMRAVDAVLNPKPCPFECSACRKSVLEDPEDTLWIKEESRKAIQLRHKVCSNAARK